MERLKNTGITRHLHATERPFLLRITKAYKTPPNLILPVLAVVPPLAEVAGTSHFTQTTLHDEIDNNRTNTTENAHPAY